jgi:cytochrome-b5 reductase
MIHQQAIRIESSLSSRLLKPRLWSSSSSSQNRALSSSSFLSQPPVAALVPPGMCQFTPDFQSVPLLERREVSPTSSILRFGLPDTTQPLNLSTCACILARAGISIGIGIGMDDTNQDVMEIRPYTPISTNALVGSFELLVKNYGDKGIMSRHLCETIQVGESIDFKHIDPNVKIQAPFAQKNVCMLTGGTGITPMIQALHAILGDASSHNQVTMLYGSQVSTDILASDLLDQWDQDYPDQLQVTHVLSNEPQDSSSWKGERGILDEALLHAYLPPPDDNVIILVCGPPPMYKALCGPRDEPTKLTGILADMGYKVEQVFKF